MKILLACRILVVFYENYEISISVLMKAEFLSFWKLLILDIFIIFKQEVIGVVTFLRGSQSEKFLTPQKHGDYLINQSKATFNGA